jgi:hypothetical protein
MMENGSLQVETVKAQILLVFQEACPEKEGIL